VGVQERRRERRVRGRSFPTVLVREASTPSIRSAETSESGSNAGHGVRRPAKSHRYGGSECALSSKEALNGGLTPGRLASANVAQRERQATSWRERKMTWTRVSLVLLMNAASVGCANLVCGCLSPLI
jgi:hypothetical protein